MDAENPSGRETVEGIEIDYDHLDVAAIMTQVKRVAARNPGEPLEAGPDEPPPPPAEPPASPVIPEPAPSAEPPASPVIPAPAGPPPGPPAPSLKARLKAKFSRAIRPFAPAIRLLGLPLHEDIEAAFRLIDATNRRMDEHEQVIHKQIDRRLDELQVRTDRRFDELQIRTDRRMDDMQDRTDRRMDDMQDRIDARFHDVVKEFDNFRDRLDLFADRSMEYIKLLHNLDHNLVVEITKLRIEFETLKSRARILEKDLDAQSQREKILEKRLGS
ncbi:MAG: hypothetical protein NTW38_01740 [Candidatus Aminicenantes bacterium]|nr:hypothetical protein [Candidatus Aminicenantes bacterium]